MLDWDVGSNALLELFSPAGSGVDPVYQLKYTPPFRATIRPPIERCDLGAADLTTINDQLDQLVESLDKARGTGGTPPVAGAPAESLEKMQMFGEMLLSLVLPPYVRADLRAPDLFLEFGIDESLLDYPWELMHDGENFVCLKHAVGRFVNNAQVGPDRGRPATRVGDPIDPLRLLIVSVPKPQPQNGNNFEELVGAEAETQSLVEVLVPGGQVEVNVLAGKDATFENVFQALKTGVYHILHFNGHAVFNDSQPRSSGLVLFNRTMMTGSIASFIGRNPPFLCFVNGCETARIGAWRGRYSIYGLARAFLDTGAYLLGTRWRVSDDAAAMFARRFYEALLLERKSIGLALREARKDCQSRVPADEFAWASYVLYGDPRVCLRHI